MQPNNSFFMQPKDSLINQFHTSASYQLQDLALHTHQSQKSFTPCPTQPKISAVVHTSPNPTKNRRSLSQLPNPIKYFISPSHLTKPNRKSLKSYIPLQTQPKTAEVFHTLPNPTKYFRSLSHLSQIS